MKFGSLFTGIAGFDIGLEQSGMQCTWQVEIDDNCNKLLESKYPNVKRIRDVRESNRTNLEAVDLVCGGFPCQDLSMAGKRAGLAGERSGLWFEFHRIVAELKPRWVIIENVPGLLSSHKGKDFAVILRGLVECGYGVAWRILDARYFGVAQRRRRVYIVASLGNGRAAEVLFESEGVQGDSAESGEAGEGIAETFTIRTGSEGGGKGYLGLKDGAMTLGGQPQWVAGTLSANRGGLDQPAGNANELDFCVPTMRSNGDAHSGFVDGDGLIAFQQNTRNEVRQIDGDGQIVGALSAQAGMKQQNYIARCQTSRNERINAETENLIAFDWQAAGSERTYIHRKDGKAQLSGRADAIAGMLRANAGMPRHDADNSKQVSSLVGVRRLTPIECERLQGFKDGWTDGFSDSTRYRMLGNAQCVNVSKWLGGRIMESESR